MQMKPIWICLIVLFGCYFAYSALVPYLGESNPFTLDTRKKGVRSSDLVHSATGNIFTLDTQRSVTDQTESSKKEMAPRKGEFTAESNLFQLDTRDGGSRNRHNSSNLTGR